METILEIANSNIGGLLLNSSYKSIISWNLEGSIEPFRRIILYRHYEIYKPAYKLEKTDESSLDGTDFSLEFHISCENLWEIMI